MRSPHFITHWHSAFTEPQLVALLQLVNKVYAEKALSDVEFGAVEDLTSCVTATGHERKIDPVHHVEQKLKMARAISNAVSDPMWRKLWNEFKVARQEALVV